MTDPAWITDAQETPEPTQQIQSALNRRKKLLDTISYLDSHLKESKAALRQIEEQELPDLFDTMNVSEVRDSLTGKRLKLEQVITATLTNPDTRARAVRWLRDQGLDDLIERTVSASFRRGEDDKANEALNALLQVGGRIEDEELVNTNSFKSAVREMMEQGLLVPTDDIGVYVVRKVVIKN